MTETVEFFKGLNFTVKYQIESTRAHFVVYEIISGNQYSEVLYVKCGGIRLVDETKNLEDAEVYLEANIESDGEMEATIMPNNSGLKGRLDFGGKRDAVAFGKLLEGIYDVAAYSMASW